MVYRKTDYHNNPYVTVNKRMCQGDHSFSRHMFSHLLEIDHRVEKNPSDFTDVLIDIYVSITRTPAFRS